QRHAVCALAAYGAISSFFLFSFYLWVSCPSFEPDCAVRPFQPARELSQRVWRPPPPPSGARKSSSRPSGRPVGSVRPPLLEPARALRLPVGRLLAGVTDGRPQVIGGAGAGLGRPGIAELPSEVNGPHAFGGTVK